MKSLIAPFDAYKGNEPYIFVSYAHRNSEIVFRHITRLREEGFRIWYDEGIDPGADWSDEIAKALAKATSFLVFVSPEMVESRNVKKEIVFALKHNKHMIPLHIAETTLPPGLDMQLGSDQALLEDRFNDKEKFYERLFASLPPETRESKITQQPPAPVKKHDSISINQNRDDRSKLLKWAISAAVAIVAIVVGALLLSNRPKTPTAAGAGNNATDVQTVARNTVSIEGVKINGVVWAPCNVDKPGTFAAKPEDPGMFYQWNRKVGWSATDPMVNSDGGTKWDATVPEGTTWEKANDPSPAGWRVPTLDEIKTLLDTKKVRNEWTNYKNIGGMLFTDINSGNSIFLPAAGSRYSNSGEYMINFSLGNSSGNGNYWSTYYENYQAVILMFFTSNAFRGKYHCLFGFNIRPVAE